MKFWNLISRFILRSRLFILIGLILITVFLASQYKYLHFSHTEANILPKDHIINVQYNRFLELFGEEGNLILLAVKDSTIFTPEKFNAWNELTKQLKANKEVALAISIKDIQLLKKDTLREKFVLEPLIQKLPESQNEIDAIKSELLNNLPFYENLLYNKKGTIQTLVYLDKKIVNSPVRKAYVLDVLNPLIEKFEKENQVDVRVSGMPFIRTMNAANIAGEMNLFMGLALAVTILIFYFFFRSWRATLVTMVVVVIGVMWALGFTGLFHYEISILTALIPPLIIVIGVPNAIFLINKYQQEVKKHGNKAKSLHRVISRVGTASLMTNLTTAIGFGTFIFTKSQLLSEFGIIASISIMSLYLLALTFIPIVYSFVPIPNDQNLKHLERTWINKVLDWIENTVKHHRLSIYIATVLLIIISMIGVYFMRVSGSLIEDMPKNKQFTKDIKFFEQEFGGVMALEFLIDTKKPGNVYKLTTLKKMEKLNEMIDEIPELSKSVSVVNAIKFSKQAFYNGNPEYYELPTQEESLFLGKYIKNSANDTQLMNSFVDSTGRYTRMTTYMKDIGTDKMERIEERLQDRINNTFPKKKYEITMTGKALVFLKGTNYLIFNLIITLGLTILLISIFMGWLFRSLPMIIISLIPNMLPLLITAGIMGFVGIPLKPSTILVFSVAFGISVDNTIHFLTRYRQVLQAHNWKVNKSIYAALRETGISMFYTSVVLFFGFLVFIVSSFGGTKAMGGLISGTLLVAMFSNLMLLPALLLSLEKRIANKKVLKEPTVDVWGEEEN
jgi:predicted RND superfamily exporter protein